MGNNRIYLSDWSIDGDRVKLVYSDEDVVYVQKVDLTVHLVRLSALRNTKSFVISPLKTERSNHHGNYLR